MQRPVSCKSSVFLLLLAFCAGWPVCGQSSASADGASQALKDEFRMPWTRNEGRYIRRWLVAGAFSFQDSQPSGALHTDFLAEQGGESSIDPRQGMKARRADGSNLTWKWLDSWGDVVNLADSVEGPKEYAVAYAFASVSRAKAGKALLSVGSDECVRVWVNGKLVLDRQGERSLTPDEDQVEVEMNSGENRLLVKVIQTWGPWTFCARILEPGAVLNRMTEIGPSLTKRSDEEVVIKTDIGGEKRDRRSVRVEAVAPGGRVLSSRTVSRGGLAILDARDWPDGPYEIRCTTRTLEGRLYVTHLPGYKGDSLAAAQELTAAAARSNADSPEGMTLKMLADMVEDRLGGKPRETQGNPWWKIHSPLLEYEELKLEAEGNQARVRPHGFVRLAYRDEVDGSPQFCRAYLPAGYDPSQKWPLVLQLHGYNPANPPYVRWWSADSRHPAINSEFGNHQGVIYMEPHGRGNTSYLGLGDNDVLRVIALAKAKFNIDEDRVYLTGDSMGGWGTWHVGTRHPELFAAIAPVYGGADYHAQMTEEELVQLSSLERHLKEKQSSFALADALLHMPIFIHHGDVDKAVNVEYSRWATRLLSRWGYNVRYREIPGRGHEALDVMNDIIEWFLQHRRDPNPRQVRIRSAQLRYASAYWARVDQSADPLAFMAVDAEIIGPNLVRLDTENVLEIALSPSRALVTPHKPLTVIWNGVRNEAEIRDGCARLRAGSYEPASLSKRPELPGTMGDFTSTPFAVVIGTISKDPEMVAMCREKAGAFIGFWRSWQNQEPRVFEDVSLSEADAGRYSLLLIGGPEANAVASRLSGELPLQIDVEGVAIDGKRFQVRDAAVQMIYPNPLNAERYLLVVAGTSAEGMFFADVNNRESLADWDFIVKDGHIPAPGQRLSTHRLRVVSGLFDHSWRAQDLLLVAGDAEARSKARLTRRPKANFQIDFRVYDEYAGSYQIEGGPRLEVTRDADRLMVQAGGNPMIELIPASESEFFVREVNVQVTFTRDAEGKVSGLEGHQEGRPFSAKRE
jgi:dienelactone hydrolase